MQKYGFNAHFSFSTVQNWEIILLIINKLVPQNIKYNKKCCYNTTTNLKQREAEHRQIVSMESDYQTNYHIPDSESFQGKCFPEPILNKFPEHESQMFHGQSTSGKFSQFLSAPVTPAPSPIFLLQAVILSPWCIQSVWMAPEHQNVVHYDS